MSTHTALRYEAALKVTGSAVFEAEVPAPGMLHAALVEAPIACGEVLSIDATHAAGLAGFAAILLPGGRIAAAVSRDRLDLRARRSLCAPARALVVAGTLLEARAAAQAVQIARSRVRR